MKAVYSRKPNRCASWDYSNNGKYFITICTEQRKCILGKGIVGDGVLDVPRVELTENGKLCVKHIEEMNSIYSDIQTEKFIVMPNHVHMIITIDKSQGTSRTPSPTNELIPRYISTLKRLTNKDFGENVWERSYHDHIIRSDDEYSKIWQYIDSNAVKWQNDCFYTEQEVKP